MKRNEIRRIEAAARVGAATAGALAFLILLSGPAASLHAAEPADAVAPTEGDRRLSVLTTLGVLADVTREIGRERVDVDALADPGQDPHYVQARPTLMKKARGADALILVGLELELWADLVADGSANGTIQRGRPGRIVASRGIRTLQLPEVLTRDAGHVHPQGNPHVWLDPVNFRTIAANVARGLSEIDPGHRDTYEANLAAYTAKLDAALFGPELVAEVGGDRLARLAEQGRLFEYLERRELADRLGGWLARASSLRGQRIVSYHQTWIYLARRFGFDVPIEIEEKPGIPPSARHRERVIDTIRETGASAILGELLRSPGGGVHLGADRGARSVRADRRGRILRGGQVLRSDRAHSRSTRPSSGAGIRRGIRRLTAAGFSRSSSWKTSSG
jgi:zinc/manganese transport system substrate-binding protein